MNNALVSMSDMTSMAASMVKSKMFGFKTPEEALSIMLIAQAEGRHPALAARDYHVIQGRPALKADAMLARFQQEGGVVEWQEYTDAKVTGSFSHPRACPKPVSITWTLDMAKRIGLANKDNWRNYPRAMLRSRVISEGVRTAYPGIAVGIYTVDEMQDMAREKDITPAAGAGDDLSPDQRVKVSDLADKVREWMNQGSLTDAYGEIDNAGLDADEQVFLWTHFDSRSRRQLKEEGDRQRLKAKAAAPALEDRITEPQRRRLEARISELKLNRDAVKETCMQRFGKEHFSELSKAEYEAIDAILDDWPTQPSPAPPERAADPASDAESTPGSAGEIAARRKAADAYKNASESVKKAFLEMNGDGAPIERMTMNGAMRAEKWLKAAIDAEAAQ